MNKPISEDQRQFILKTLLPYKENRKRCSTVAGTNGLKRCAYISKHGRKCAIGQHMKPGEWQKVKGDFYTLVDIYKPSEFFTEEALKQDFNNYTWKMIQWYHDCIALKNDPGNAVFNLEEATGVEFPELK